MLNCKQTSLLVSQSLDRRLTWRERWAVRAHLLICVYCRRFKQQLLWIRSHLSRWQQHVAENQSLGLSTVAKERMTQQLDKLH